MGGQLGLSELSVISWVSAFEGCPLSRVPLYNLKGGIKTTFLLWHSAASVTTPSQIKELMSWLQRYKWTRAFRNYSESSSIIFTSDEHQDLVLNSCECNRLRGWERLSCLTEERWELSELVKPWTGALQSSGISLCPCQEESFSELTNLPGVEGLSICPTLMVTTGLQELLLYTPHLYTWRLNDGPGFNCACNRNCKLRLHTGAVISRLHKPSMQSWDWLAVSGFWECAVQSQDCSNS